MEIVMKRLLMLLVLAMLTAPLWAQTYTVFDYPGATVTQPTAINKNGAVVGVWSNGVTSGSFWRKSTGSMIKLGKTRSHVLFPRAINTSIVVGDLYQCSFWLGADNVPHQFCTGGGTSEVRAINDSGMMAGYTAYRGYSIGWIETVSGGGKQININGAQYVMPASIDSLNDVSGMYIDTSGVAHGFLYFGGTPVTVDITGAVGTQVAALDENGYYAGTWWDTMQNHSFVYDANGLTLFDPVGSTSDGVNGRNKAGYTVGSYTDVNGLSHGYRRGPKGVITTIDPPGSINTFVEGMNAGGKVIGWYQDAANLQHGFIYTP
jgi:hypothetical protein